jgi:hypothetical protein
MGSLLEKLAGKIDLPTKHPALACVDGRRLNIVT